jgi:hypothetical protein
MTKTAAKYHEVRYRIAGADTAWSEPQRFAATAEKVVNGLSRGKTYNVQARSISACGAMSGWADQADIVVPATNQRVSQSNINMLRVGGVGSAWTGFSISYTSTPTAATISCTAGTLQDGADNPAYAASSVAVSGAADTTVTYYLYYDDPQGNGGTFALGATTTYSDLSANQGRINVGEVAVNFPATGTGGGAGAPGGGGSGCVTIDSMVIVLVDGGEVPTRAGDVKVGDVLRLFDEVTLEPLQGTVSYSEAKLQPCVEISTASGKILHCSVSAPIPTQRGGLRTAPNVAGHAVAIRVDSVPQWDDVTTVRVIGERMVQHITCENGCFWADDVGHHNLKPAQELP